MSARVSVASGLPLTGTMPSRSSRSSGVASSMCAAISKIFCLSLLRRPATAPASMTVIRLPPGPADGRPCIVGA